MYLIYNNNNKFTPLVQFISVEQNWFKKKRFFIHENLLISETDYDYSPFFFLVDISKNLNIIRVLVKKPQEVYAREKRSLTKEAKWKVVFQPEDPTWITWIGK